MLLSMVIPAISIPFCSIDHTVFQLTLGLAYALLHCHRSPHFYLVALAFLLATVMMCFDSFVATLWRVIRISSPSLKGTQKEHFNLETVPHRLVSNHAKP